MEHLGIEGTPKCIANTAYIATAITSLFMGASFWDEVYCPYQNVALLLLTFGLGAVLIPPVLWIFQFWKEVGDDYETRTWFHLSDVSLILLVTAAISSFVGWLTLSSLRIYGLWMKVQFVHVGENSYCDPALFWYAFSVNSVILAGYFMGVVVSVVNYKWWLN
ncbi:hypothetical protein Fcan01_01322 [Folsomia candida]|uniref:Uncharacterized protein n=1 Tax=Folsomia candida TaxID=158441 RepID=A0A226F006_FOLCA|nr:hypothetical protein Fcan01_01322 [Folsomia candida]